MDKKKHTKIKNYTESDEIRIKGAGKFIEDTTKSRQLVIYIGGSLFEKCFGDVKKVDIQYGYTPDTNNRYIRILKLAEGQKGYSSHITGNGYAGTRKIVVSVPNNFLYRTDYNNRSINYVIEENFDIGFNLGPKIKVGSVLKEIKGGEYTEEEIKNYAIRSKQVKNIKPKKSRIKKEIQIDVGSREYNKWYAPDELADINYDRFEKLDKEIEYIKSCIEDTNSLMKLQNLILRNTEVQLNHISDTISIQDLEVIKDVIRNIPPGYNRLCDKIDDILDEHADNKVKHEPINTADLIQLLVKIELEKKNKKDNRSLFGRIFGE